MKQGLRKIHMGEAKLALDLSDGSERGEYVDQDYILGVLGRPHRNINLMYTYYPKDKQWPQRISEACKDMEINFQWDYPYDDYFPYGAEGEPFASMQDIRKHGQDVTLTLTIDCSLDDSYLRKIAQELRPYGRMRIRINHECAGDWFTHNRRFSFKEIADFFVRFAKILKEEAPNVKTIFCGGASTEEGKPVAHEDDFIEAYKIADVWSYDCYLALHFGWPYDIAEKGDGGRWTASSVEHYYQLFKRTAKRLTELTGEAKPMITGEFNTDGDVTGSLRQGESVIRFAKKLRDEKVDWFHGITYYQFRDRGRLGLELEDPSNKHHGIPLPILKEYKELLKDPYFMPEVSDQGGIELPFTFRWGGAEDAEGLALTVPFEASPEFCEVTLQEDLSLMLEINGKWFYKAPSVKTIDLMPAFFENPLTSAKDLELKIFATPKDGVNVNDGREDWDINYYATMTEMPELRIRYESVQDVK